MQLVNTSACHAEDRGFESRRNRHYGFIAQSVEQGTENPCVAGSIPALGIFYCLYVVQAFFLPLTILKLWYNMLGRRMEDTRCKIMMCFMLGY